MARPGRDVGVTTEKDATSTPPPPAPPSTAMLRDALPSTGEPLRRLPFFFFPPDREAARSRKGRGAWNRTEEGNGAGQPRRRDGSGSASPNSAGENGGGVGRTTPLGVASQVRWWGGNRARALLKRSTPRDAGVMRFSAHAFLFSQRGRVARFAGPLRLAFARRPVLFL